MICVFFLNFQIYIYLNVYLNIFRYTYNANKYTCICLYSYILCVFDILPGLALSMLPLPSCICIILSSEHMECSITSTSHTWAQRNRKGQPPNCDQQIPSCLSSHDWIWRSSARLSPPHSCCLWVPQWTLHVSHKIMCWGNSSPQLQTWLSNEFRATSPKTNGLSCKDPWRAFGSFYRWINEIQIIGVTGCSTRKG